MFIITAKEFKGPTKGEVFTIGPFPTIKEAENKIGEMLIEGLDRQYNPQVSEMIIPGAESEWLFFEGDRP